MGVRIFRRLEIVDLVHWRDYSATFDYQTTANTKIPWRKDRITKWWRLGFIESDLTFNSHGSKIAN
jgi:hypothetical protein